MLWESLPAFEHPRHLLAGFLLLWPHHELLNGSRVGTGHTGNGLPAVPEQHAGLQAAALGCVRILWPGFNAGRVAQKAGTIY